MVALDLYLDTLRNPLAKNRNELDFHVGLVQDMVNDA